MVEYSNFDIKMEKVVINIIHAISSLLKSENSKKSYSEIQFALVVAVLLLENIDGSFKL